MVFKPCRSVTLEDVIRTDDPGPLIDCEDYDGVVICPSIPGFNKITKYAREYRRTINLKTGKYSEKKSSIDNIKTRRYIVPGEECMVCYEPIISKHSAYITNCGHRFHYGCIQRCDYVDSNRLGQCPMCRHRHEHGEESHYLKLRYDLSNKSLDRLEDFWFNFDTLNPQKCYKSDKWGCNIYDEHVLGMKSSCAKCLNFKKGKYFPQFNRR